MGLATATIYELQREGNRITKAREALIELFISHGKPLNVIGIQHLLSLKGMVMHKVTLYREIEFLKEKYVIQEVHFGTEEAFYESTEREHHHHMVCIKCKKIKDVPFEEELEQVEEKIYKKMGYSRHRHSIEFFGLCKKCEKNY